MVNLNSFKKIEFVFGLGFLAAAFLFKDLPLDFGLVSFFYGGFDSGFFIPLVFFVTLSGIIIFSVSRYSSNLGAFKSAFEFVFKMASSFGSGLHFRVLSGVIALFSMFFLAKFLPLNPVLMAIAVFFLVQPFVSSIQKKQDERSSKMIEMLFKEEPLTSEKSLENVELVAEKNAKQPNMLIMRIALLAFGILFLFPVLYSGSIKEFSVWIFLFFSIIALYAFSFSFVQKSFEVLRIDLNGIEIVEKNGNKIFVPINDAISITVIQTNYPNATASVAVTVLTENFLANKTGLMNVSYEKAKQTLSQSSLLEGSERFYERYSNQAFFKVKK